VNNCRRNFVSGLRGIDCNTVAAVSYAHWLTPKFAVDRRSLALSSALSSTLVLSLLLASLARAADECGPLAASVTCTSTSGVGNPYPDGIEYNPPADFSLFVNSTAIIDTTGSGADGISIPQPGNGLPDGDIFVGLEEGVSITADQDGISVYVDTGSITIDSDATIDAGGYGILAIDYGANSDVSIATTGSIDAVASGISVFTYGSTSDITIVNDGDIEALDNIGIGSFTGGESASITITNSGDVSSLSRIAIASTTLGNGSDIAITNDGDINAALSAIAARTYGIDSDTTVVNTGDVTAGANGIFLRSYGTGVSIDSDIALTNSGALAAGGDGIFAISYGGGSDISIDNSGPVIAGDDGIYATTSGNATNVAIVNSGDIQGGNIASDYSAGIYVAVSGDGDNVSIANSGALSSVYGIFAINYGLGGALSIFNDGSITAFYSAIFAYGDFNTVTIENSADLYAGANGIGVISNTGYASIDNNGDIEAGFVGAGATTFGDDGDIAITNVGAVAAYSFGIATRTFGTESDATIVNSGDVTAGVHGIFLRSYSAGSDADSDITITNSGAITAAVDGIRTLTLGGGSDIAITNSGPITAGDNGVYAITYGDAANVTIVNSGDLKGGDYGPDYSSGIYVTTNGGSSKVSITNSGSLDAVYGVVVFLNGSDSDLIVTNSGAITAQYAGVTTLAYGERSNSVIINNGDVETIYAGVQGFSDADYSNVTITNSGDLTSTGDGPVARGIGGRTNGDYSDVTIINTGDIVSNNYGMSLLTSGVESDIKVENDGDIAAVGRGMNIRAFGSGAISISNSGDVDGGPVGVYSLSSTSTEIINTGSISAASGLAIDTLGASTTIVNSGAVLGFIDLTDNADSFTNEVDGVFAARLTSDFGGGTDSFTNAGIVKAADDPALIEDVYFGNLETFNNGSPSGGPGLISLVDDQVGDNFAIGPAVAFTGQGESNLTADAFLATGPAGLADHLIINGNSFGSTGLFINNINPNGSSPNFVGIPVVVVNGVTSESDFDLNDPAFNAGFFAWDLFLDGNVHELRTVGLGLGAFEFPAGVTAAQDIWYQMTGIWLNRQADLRLAFNQATVTPTADLAQPTPATPFTPVTPGIWMKGVGASIDRESNKTTTDPISERAYTFNLDREQDLWGIVAGADFGAGDWLRGDGTLLLGILSSYVDSNLDFSASNTKWNYSGPSLGAYATYLWQGLYVDALVQADFLNVDIKATGLSLNDKVSSDITNFGGRLDAGYQFLQSESFFIEPQATFAVLDTNFDDIKTFGGTISEDNNLSVRGRLGVRIGTTLIADEVTVSPDLIASVWQEFKGDNSITISGFGSAFPAFSVSDNIDPTFGDVSVGLNAVGTAGWSGFMRGHYQFSDNYQSWSGEGGIRYAF
jgi:outer membrane autotransporter protein